MTPLAVSPVASCCNMSGTMLVHAPITLILTEPRTGQLLGEVRGFVSGLPGAVGLRLQPRQEFEQNLLRDFAASSFQVRKGCEAEAAVQAVVLGFKMRVSRDETSVRSHSLCRGRRGRGARHDRRSNAQWQRRINGTNVKAERCVKPETTQFESSTASGWSLQRKC